MNCKVKKKRFERCFCTLYVRAGGKKITRDIRGQTGPSGPAGWNWPVSRSSPHTHKRTLSAHSHPPTLCQTGLSSVHAPWSPDGLWEAATLEVTEPARCSTVTCWLCHFTAPGRIWCHPPTSEWENWNEAVQATLKWNVNALRNFYLFIFLGGKAPKIRLNIFSDEGLVCCR